jgi:hypothetical protein
MTSTEIRVKGIEAPSNSMCGREGDNNAGAVDNLGLVVGCLTEIAAQLAELNERIGRITAGTEHVCTDIYK